MNPEISLHDTNRMQMLRLNICYRWIFTGVFFTAFFLYFLIFNRYHLIYQEQIQLFRFNKDYFTEFLSRPGGLSEFIGAFFTQFFIFPVTAALILTIAGFALYKITGYIFRKHQFYGVLWAYIPVLILAALHSDYLYTMAYTIGLLISLGYFSIYLSVKNRKLRYSFVLIGFPLLYFLTGGYVLLTALLCFVHELLFNRDHSRYIISLIFPVVTFFVPYLASHTIFYLKDGTAWMYFLPLFMDASSILMLILSLVYFPLIIIVAKGWPTWKNGEGPAPGWNWETILTGTIIILSLSGLIYKFFYDRKTEILLGIDHRIQNSDWDGALKLSSANPEKNRLVTNFTNLALYKSGRMGDQLFHFPQAGPGGLWLDWKQDWIIALFGGEIYYHLAYNSEAYRWAFEAMTAKGQNPRSLKRLVLTSFIDDNTELAEKYLRVLEQTLFYRNWAQSYLSYVDHPDLMVEDKEISEKRYFRIHSDFINSDNVGVRLPQLLADHPDNHMAFEYLMASFLLDKNLEGFAANIFRIKELGYKTLPVHYEEALIAYMSYANKDIVPKGYTISQTTLNRLSEYAAAIYSYGKNTDVAARELYGKFGKTYWYYSKFVNSQPQ